MLTPHLASLRIQLSPIDTARLLVLQNHTDQARLSLRVYKVGHPLRGSSMATLAAGIVLLE